MFCEGIPNQSMWKVSYFLVYVELCNIFCCYCLFCFFFLQARSLKKRQILAERRQKCILKHTGSSNNHWNKGQWAIYILFLTLLMLSPGASNTCPKTFAISITHIARTLHWAAFLPQSASKRTARLLSILQPKRWKIPREW